MPTAPNPDRVTAEAIERVRADLIDRFDRELHATIKSITVRVDAMDKANTVLADNVNRVPTLLDRTVANIQSESGKAGILYESKLTDIDSLFTEKLNGMLTKFDGIQVQFRERDIRTDQDKIAASTAVNAALQAQKEAAGAQNESNATALAKSETGVTKELDGIKLLINSKVDGLSADINNLTSRLDRGDGSAHGSQNVRTENRATVAMWAVVGGLAFGILTWFVGFNFRHDPVPVATGIGVPPGYTLVPAVPGRS